LTNRPLREFLEIPYDELEELNLSAKKQRLDRTPMDVVREARCKYLADTPGIKSVTVCFSDLEGRLHMLDYDKKFLLKSADNLTFDGSSIRGFSAQKESDLRLALDWPAFYWLPSDVFGAGKVLAFGDVLERDGSPYPADMRSRLKLLSTQYYQQHGYTCHAANEIEGFLFKGKHAEQDYSASGFEFITTSGYYHSLPGDPLRDFIDAAAEAQRAMGFANEKDHPEVAPSQFELNYAYTEVTAAADQVMLYKLLCRQIAHQQEMTASFLPKPVSGVNGSGMHTNMSISDKQSNLFYDASGQDNLSEFGWDYIGRILQSAPDLCLILNSSVNAYRRLDPHFEAPNQIKASAIDRGSMIRIPLGNSHSARIEVRSIAPDANPYLAIYALLRVGVEGNLPKDRRGKEGAARRNNEDRLLFDNIYDAIDAFAGSEVIRDLIGAEVQGKFAQLKRDQADRCPRKLGALIKTAEVQYHHEITNQYLWNQF
jgi:glutamine synthetase